MNKDYAMMSEDYVVTYNWETGESTKSNGKELSNMVALDIITKVNKYIYDNGIGSARYVKLSREHFEVLKMFRQNEMRVYELPNTEPRPISVYYFYGVMLCPTKSVKEIEEIEVF